MARKGWSNLSAGQRARYLRHGIDRAAYERGVPLAGARGHGSTPEHPLPATADIPLKYQKWYNAHYGSPIKMLTDGGDQWLVSVSKSNRSRIASHWNAVKTWLYSTPAPSAWWWKGNSDRALDAFERLTVRGVPFEPESAKQPSALFRFMTDFDDLVNWIQGDNPAFNTIYAKVA